MPKPELYERALNSPKLDTSDYILLAIAILKEILRESVKDDIKKIEVNYMNFDYEDAITKINELCEANKDNERYGSLFELIPSLQSHLVDNQMENQSRRYFETKLSQEIWHSLGKSDFTSLAKFNALMREKLIEMIAETSNDSSEKKQKTAIAALANLPPDVRTIHDASKAIGGMRNFGISSQEVTEIEEELRSHDGGIAQTKDRGAAKPADKDPDHGTWSENPGIVKSTAPMMPADRLKKSVKNKVADTFYLDTEHPGYSAARPKVPYVNSISGTTYRLAAVLKLYMEKNADDPNLEIDVNNITKSFVSYTCKKGFHSYGEMIDALHDPSVQKLFTDRNISINTSFINDQTLTNLVRESSTYSKDVNLQRGLIAEYADRRPLKMTSALDAYIRTSKETHLQSPDESKSPSYSENSTTGTKTSTPEKPKVP